MKYFNYNTGSRNYILALNLACFCFGLSFIDTKVAAASRASVPPLTNIQQIFANLKHSLQFYEENMEFFSNFHRDIYYDKELENLNLLEAIETTLEGIITKKENTISLLPLSKYPNVSLSCEIQLLQYVTALKERQDWAIQLIDALGKPPSGLLEGALVWVGDIQECLNITQSDDWNGKYCTVGKPANFSIVTAFPMFKYGICVPDKCNELDIAEIVNALINSIPENITRMIPIKIDPIDPSYITCQPLSKSLDPPGQIGVTIISIIVGIILLGTLYDIYKRSIRSFQQKLLNETQIVDSQSQSIINDDDKERLVIKYQDEHEPALFKALLSFSAYTNTIKLFQINTNQDQLECLHAIRFLSISWVILGHTYAFAVGYLDNLAIMNVWFKRFSFLFVSNAFFSVDNFFVMSGLLTCYLFMKEVDKKGKISWHLMFKYYFHRIWRLTPPYMLIVMFSATLTKYLGTGPLYPTDGFELNQCKNTWWTNLFYINNFVKVDEPCLGVSWYLANDMQFHWFSPIMLIPFALGKKTLGLIITISIIVAHIIITALVINHYPGSEMGMFATTTDKYFYKVYITPWCRIGPFAIGILLGYAIYLFKKKSGQKFRLELNLSAWLFSLVILGVMLFGLYPDFNGHPLSKVSHILYQACSRTIWAIGLGYIIYACITSNGGFVNKIFSWFIWTPLSRLSYSAYLIHSTILLYYVYTQDKPIHFQDSTVIYMFMSTLTFSFAAAYLVSIVFEVPLLGLEKFIINK